MKPILSAIIGAACFVAAGSAQAETLTIATVNNGDMIRMQGLTSEFTKANPGIEVKWVTLEENVLREKVTVDIATKGGQYDVLTIGTYEVPIWAKKNWLVPLDNLGADYDVDDLLPPIRAGLSADGKLYAAPFYGESSMIMYRKDLFEKAGLTMPEQPTWDFIIDAAKKRPTIRRRVRHLPARQGRLGREHGLHHRHGEFVRRPLVRREVDPPIRQPRMEGDPRYLSQGDEGVGPARRGIERLQREPGAVQLRQMRHVDRCHGCRRLRDRSQGIQGRRQGRLRLGSEQGIGQERQLAVGVVARRSRRVEQGRSRREVHRLGDEQAMPSWWRPRKGGPMCRPAPASRSTTIRSIRRLRPSPS